MRACCRASWPVKLRNTTSQEEVVVQLAAHMDPPPPVFVLFSESCCTDVVLPIYGLTLLLHAPSCCGGLESTHVQNTAPGPKLASGPLQFIPQRSQRIKESIKCRIMLMNQEANDYNEPVLLFNLTPTEGAV